jgi:SHS2 domain-containing protein
VTLRLVRVCHPLTRHPSEYDEQTGRGRTLGTYTVFDHTADVGLDVRGDSLPDLLATAARAAFDQMLEDWPTEAETQERVESSPPPGLEGDLGELLVGWLQELLYRFETRRLVPLQYDFEPVGPGGVRARVVFGRFVAGRHRTRREVKAVTYHQLLVRQEPGGPWSARFILDV